LPGPQQTIQPTAGQRVPPEPDKPRPTAPEARFWQPGPFTAGVPAARQSPSPQREAPDEEDLLEDDLVYEDFDDEDDVLDDLYDDDV
jgi:hypothetical protein